MLKSPFFDKKWMWSRSIPSEGRTLEQESKQKSKKNLSLIDVVQQVGGDFL